MFWTYLTHIKCKKVCSVKVNFTVLLAFQKPKEKTYWDNVKFENEFNNLICALIIIFSNFFNMEKIIKWTKIYLKFDRTNWF